MFIRHMTPLYNINTKYYIFIFKMQGSDLWNALPMTTPNLQNTTALGNTIQPHLYLLSILGCSPSLLSARVVMVVLIWYRRNRWASKTIHCVNEWHSVVGEERLAETFGGHTNIGSVEIFMLLWHPRHILKLIQCPVSHQLLFQQLIL